MTALGRAGAPSLLGRISAFDEPRGLGTVTDRDGAEYPFHCTAIAGGSRTIEVGTEVAFRVVPGHLGRMEATEVAPVTP